MIERLKTALFLTALLPSLTGEIMAAETNRSARSETVSPPVALRESATVDGKTVRIGDLFVNAGEKADIAVAYAPEPGSRAVFDARWLMKVARVYKLDWRPMGRHEKVVVQRNATLISREEIADQVAVALAEKAWMRT